jgi:hypothetical protein
LGIFWFFCALQDAVAVSCSLLRAGGKKDEDALSTRALEQPSSPAKKYEGTL